MPEINFKTLPKYIANCKDKPLKERFAPVYLIYGEEMLVKTAFERLLQILLPESKHSFNYEPMDGAQDNIAEVVERLMTYSLLPGAKVVAVLDSRIFYAKQDKTRFLELAQNAYEDDDIEKAAKYLLNLMGQLNLVYDDVSKSNRAKSLGLNAEQASNDNWLDEIVAYCQDNQLIIPAADDDGELLLQAIEKGFPQDHHLFITTDLVDKRRALYKSILHEGMIVDCSVPKGERRADKIAQEAVLAEKRDTMLKAHQKSLDKAAASVLYEMTGFDLRTFTNNLEKLIHYVGDRAKITVEDVYAVVERTKVDPIFELTNAVSDRNLEKALFYLDSILSSDIHPLQVLAAISNQIRKLLLAKDFVESSFGAAWHAGCAYNQFQNSIMPAIVSYDRDLLNQIDDWERHLSAHPHGADGKSPTKGKEKKTKVTSDLLIAKNPKNSYPVYQMLKKSEHFTKKELGDAVESLYAADVQLKSSMQNPKLILEKAILDMCRKQE